ncbi:STAS domain-containing protein [Geodermatophilus sabuli]|uniref:STAS domain-containing protein n=1 Tax=Geodermatophilus sabuli TaxID=1564158 RepID=A0A7K3VUN3_9ACTN|nr:STAS domain-containing protein [Geodermatophilus sabuli]
MDVLGVQGLDPPTGWFEVVQEAEGPVLHLRGDVDSPLVHDIHAGGVDEASLVAVSVEGVGYIDSTGLSMLVRWAQSAARCGRPAVIRRATPRFCRVLELAGIAMLFQVEETRRS